MIKVLFVSVGGPPKTNAESLQVSHVMDAMLRSGEIEITWITEKLESKSKGWQTVSEKYGDLTRNLNIVELSTGGDFIRRIKSKFSPQNSFPDEKAYLIQRLSSAVVGNILLDEFDVIYSRSSPITSHALALVLKKASGLPWIGHFSDPWAWSPLTNFDEQKVSLERELIANMDLVNVTNQRSLELMLEKYGHKKIEIFSNVFGELRSAKKIKNKKFTIIHAGNFYQSRSPEFILKSLDLLQPELSKDVSLHFIGFMDDIYERMIDKHQGKFEIIKHGGLPYEKAIDLQLGADLLASIDPVLNDKDSVYLPSKVVEYMAMSIPVIAFCRPSSPTNSLIDKKFGRCFDFNDLSDSMKEVERQVIKWQKGEREVLSSPDLDYSAETQVNLLIDRIKSLI